MNKNQQNIFDLAKKKDISRMSFREIARELNIKNPQTVIYHLEKLRDKGLLYFDKDKKERVAKLRAFAVDKFFSIPIVGAANCGPAVQLAQENIEGYLRISQKSVNRPNPHGLMVVRAVGDSLNEANIHGDNVENGDYLIVDCRAHPSNGQYVLSIIAGAANFKRFYKDDKRKEIRLVSESTQKTPPIVLHEKDLDAYDYAVNGVVLRVIKNKDS